MRNEHGTDRKRLPRVYRFSAFSQAVQPPPVLCGHHGPVAVAELADSAQSSQPGELPSAADDLPMRRLEAEGEPWLALAEPGRSLGTGEQSPSEQNPTICWAPGPQSRGSGLGSVQGVSGSDLLAMRQLVPIPDAQVPRSTRVIPKAGSIPRQRPIPRRRRRLGSGAGEFA
jgi:hypothetical protein